LRQQGARVEHAMTPSPGVAHLDDPIETALPRLLSEGVDALPVVDSDHRLRGIVSYVDVLRYCEATSKG
jgi:CBS-domain-containing membrane protein